MSFFKFLVYAFAIWFFVRVLKRAVALWIGSTPKRSFNQAKDQTGVKFGQKGIKDVEDAEFTEVEDKH